jgi:hypothetical protein
MTRTTGNSVSGVVVRRLGCVKNEAVGATDEDALRTREGVRSSIRCGQKSASPLELLLERAGVELDSESATFCRTPRAPEQSAATWVYPMKSVASQARVMKNAP